MAKITISSTSSRRSETGNDDSDGSDFQESCVIHSKRKNKQKNVREKKTINTPVKNLKRRLSAAELEKADLKSKFSYAPKKGRTENEASGNECVNGTSKSVSGSSCCISKEQSKCSGVNKTSVRESYTPKSDFVINFSADVSSTESRETGKTYSSLAATKNIMWYINSISEGQKCSSVLKQIRKGPVINNVAGMEIFARHSPFDQRVTALTFHPKYPTFLAAGSKWGKVIFWDTEAWTHKVEIPATGPGGSILALKFDHENPMHVFTASITGTVQQQDFLGRENMTYFNTGLNNTWFCSMDTCVPHKLVLAGDNHGNLCLANFDGEKIWKTGRRIHKTKVTHIEFSEWDPNIFVTASLDHTIRIWDLRMFSGNPEQHVQSLYCCLQDKCVNSAYFSPSDGKSLLVTDQHSELRVYTAPLWNLQTCIPHPHRQFQHLTQIKAQWHPLEDLIVVGRFPDKNFNPKDFRSIDIYDAHTGNREHYFSTTGIASLNAFSPDGSVLASASGSNMVLWKSKDLCKDPPPKLSAAACQRLLHTRTTSRSRSTSSSRSKQATTSLQKKKF